ncbi:hypothetical protein DFS33DRAFT_1387829 [Desarmillaria ectypa]|nr:hypothetical protein DFS33DRAFT_1387829 [Desarmillaria ectypa]
MLRAGALLLSFVIRFAFASSAVHQRDLNLTAQESGLRFDIPNLIRPQSTTVSRPSIPSPCVRYTGSGKECTASMDAVNVTFADCDSPYTICHCSDANITLDDTIDALARIPQRARVYVHKQWGDTLLWSVQPTNLDTRGALLDPVCGATLIRNEQSTHAASGALGIKASGSWEEAVSNDTCVPDTYARSNLAEDLAQMSVLKVYSLLNKNVLPPGFTTDCVSNQWAFLDGLPLYNPATLFGGSCSFEPDNAEALHNIAPPTTTMASSPSMTNAVLASSGSTVSTASRPASTTPLINSSGHPGDTIRIYAALALPLFLFLLQEV